jgi:Fe-S oxidoreductase
VELSTVLPDGRAALSQGMIATSAKRALKTTDYLLPFIDQGRDIIVVEPSVLAMFRRDYKHLLKNDTLFEKLQTHSYEPLEYLEKMIQENNISVADLFDISKVEKRNLFYHPHCQQKTIGAEQATKNILESIGFNVAYSDVECCGMAGSFGFKKEFYDVSMEAGKQLFKQINASENINTERTVLASGVSCSEQIDDGMGRGVKHPLELLADLVVY